MMRKHWLYWYSDGDGVLLYVGITARPKVRHLAHKRSRWYPYWRTRDVLPLGVVSREEALAAEKQAIMSNAPVFNKTHNDAFDGDRYIANREINLRDKPPLVQYAPLVLIGLVALVALYTLI